MKYPPGTLLWTPPIMGSMGYPEILVITGQVAIGPNTPLIVVNANTQMMGEALCFTCMGLLYVDLSDVRLEPFELSEKKE